MLPANLHELGGLPLVDGGFTVPGRVWRSGMEPDAPTSVWNAVVDLGICTVIDLRNPEERMNAPAPVVLDVCAVPIERTDDPEYVATWGDRWALPDFYVWGMARWPELWDAAFGALSDARPGGLLVHCGAGRDRTGFVAALLLRAAGVERAAILQDYRRGVRESRYRNLDDHVDECVGQLDRALDRPLPERWAQNLARAGRRLRPN